MHIYSQYAYCLIFSGGKVLKWEVMCKNEGVVWLDIVRYTDSTQTHVILLSKTKITLPGVMDGEKIVRDDKLKYNM